MTEVGESVATAPPPKDDKEKKGHIKVTVVNRCKGSDDQPVEIDGAAVRVAGEDKTSDGSGVAEFKDLLVGPYGVTVTHHFKDADYVTFFAHYIFPLGALTSWKKEAKSTESEFADVADGKTTEVEVALQVYRPVDLVEFQRKQIDLGGDDKYGHWWVEIDGSESYGWWPKYPLGHPNNRRSEAPAPPPPPPPNPGWRQRAASLAQQAAYRAQSAAFAVRESSLVQTFRGVEGELNASVFGGTATRDPHHGDSADGSYQPVVDDCRSDDAIKDCIRSFAKGYAGEWHWRFESFGGKNCHSFQKEMIDHCDLSKFKQN